MDNQELPSLQMSETDFEFEPITRNRSNTWPLPRPEEYTEPSTPSTSTIHDPQIERILSTDSNDSAVSSSSSPSSSKKLSSRNAHGNTSYAELITQAINGSKNQRLTLSEIYSWMCDNVPSIKDREDKGWKNSVRHNLSLHKRFMKVPNESAGKSNWWMINPEEPVERTSRKRSSSMEAGRYQKSRGRAKKIAQQLKQKQQSPRMITLRPINYVEANQLVQQIPNTCTINYTYYQPLSTIAQVPDEVEYATQYYEPFEVVDNNSALEVQQVNVQTTPALVADTTSNEFGLTRFNSLLDDVTDIISKEMTV